jgi:hypothetical protein
MPQQTQGDKDIITVFNIGTTWTWVVNATPRPLYPCERDAVSIVEEAPGLFWKGNGE